MAIPGTYPVPPGRGRWRLTLHNRAFADGVYPSTSGIGELTDARSRKLTQALDKPAVLSFTLDGHSASAQTIVEMTQDVIAWRWDDQQNKDVIAFRGVIAQAQDTISEQTHSVDFTCHDYLALLGRRMLTKQLVYTQTDQDVLTMNLLSYAVAQPTSSGVTLTPGSYLPLRAVCVTPAGASRAFSGVLRDRTFPGQSIVLDSIDAMAKVIGGFDYDVLPDSNVQGVDHLRIFWPYQGILRTSPQLMYGSTVSTVTRTLDSANYANYERVVGNNGSSDPNAAQLYAEVWNTDANNVTVSPQGLWMNGENASDVTIQQTLADKANGDLSRDGLLVPSYAVGLRPGAYSWGNPNMGDVIPLIIQSGRLNVNTTIRVMGITYTIGDDGQEDVALTLGRPDTTFTDIFTAADADVNALARR